MEVLGQEFVDTPTSLASLVWQKLDPGFIEDQFIILLDYAEHCLNLNYVVDVYRVSPPGKGNKSPPPFIFLMYVSVWNGMEIVAPGKKNTWILSSSYLEGAILPNFEFYLEIDDIPWKK